MFLDPGGPYMWLLYALILVLYSFVALGVSLDGSKSPILSARNVKPREDIFLIHVVFLGVMFNLLLIASRLYLASSQTALSWLAFRVYRRLTLLDCGLIATAYVVALIEQRFIYVDGKTGKKDLPGDLDYY